MLSLPSLLLTEQGRGAPLSDAPGALERGGVGGGVQMCSSRAVDRSISGVFPCIQLLFTSFTISPHFKLNLRISFPSIFPPSLWALALIENANCNQISWIKMSGLKMGDMSDNSQSSAWERLLNIMGTWYEFLMVCFGRRLGWSPLSSHTCSSGFTLKCISMQKNSSHKLT